LYHVKRVEKMLEGSVGGVGGLLAGGDQDSIKPSATMASNEVKFSITLFAGVNYRGLL